MPWLNRPLLKHMLAIRQSADAIVPRWTRFPEPLHAVYGKACLEPVVASLKARQLKLVAFYGRVRVRYLEREELAMYDASGRSFANINTPDDLSQARENK
jgi:molybdopterin-guanine dinucleotide biosynthesis protein A